MGFKQLVGFCLLLAGIVLSLLFLAFLLEGKAINPSFLLYLGLCTFFSFVFGLFILNRSS